MRMLVGIALVLLGVLLGLQAWRWSDNRRAAQVWEDLAQKALGSASIFDP